jgi:integrase
MARNLLTETAVRNAKPKAKPYRLRDGDGLFLFVPKSGVRAWQFRYVLNGKGQTATLGKLSSVHGLAWARAKADEARSKAADGRNVAQEKRIAKAQRTAKAAATFASVAADWSRSEARRAKWTPDYQDEVAASLRNHLAKLDALPITEVTAAIASPMLRKVEKNAPDMAKKVRARLRSIMDHAIESGLITGNPIPAARRTKTERKHYPAILDRAGVGEILRAAEVAENARGVRRAHLLTVFTAQRIGEIVPATWDEIDLRAGTWTIPRERMKRKDTERGPHVVPLPPLLLDQMREWKRTDGAGEYVCPAPRGEGHITREAVEKFYRRGLDLANKHSPHAWRSVFSTWCRDVGKDSDVVEAQLDHVVGSKVQAAYDRAHRLDLRRELMQWYEGQLLAARDGADVVPIRGRA